MVAAFLTAALDLLLPAVCPACRTASGPGLCNSCRTLLPALPHPCAWCAAPRRAPGDACGQCGNRGLAHVQRVLVAHPYAGLVDDLVTAAKAAGRPAAVRALCALMPDLPADRPAGGVVVPIPPSRGRRPGPHLGTALAQAVARRHALPCRRLLATTRLAAEQHRLSGGERRDNVADLFRCRMAPPAYVVLVDDLVTSGATASSAAAALRQAGATRVDLVCLARTPLAGEMTGKE
jgi:predicted amidophosphoribosyltransferase